MLRHKVAQVVEHFALAPDSHDGKALQHILESFPRDELFQASVAELTRIVTGIFGLQERPRVRVLLRRDPFRRFYSCLVFVPREKYNTQVRQRIETVIREAFSAFSMESQVQIAESNLARIHIVARTSPSEETRIDADALGAARRRRGAFLGGRLQGRAAGALRRGVRAAAVREVRAGLSRGLHRGLSAARPPRSTCRSSRRSRRSPERLHLDIYRPDPRRKDKFFLKIFRSQDAIPISDLLPMLENMGLKVIAERPYELEFPGRPARLDPGSGTGDAGAPRRSSSKRWSARSRAPSPRSGPAAWTATASTS